jgi:4-aminobutyrate aminotransferase-like enzyme
MKKTCNILDHNAFSFDDDQKLGSDVSELIRRRMETIGPTSMLFYKEPLNIVRGKGVWLFDNKGDKYLDVYNNVASIGHCHPKVITAITKQLNKVNVHSRYLHDTVLTYSERLLSTMPDNLNRLVMTCSGSESNDLALRLANTYTSKSGIIVTESAYHGNTSLVTGVSPSALKMDNLPDNVVTIPINDLTRWGSDAEQKFCDYISQAIEKLNSRGYGFSAFLADTIFSSDGVYSHPSRFMQSAVDLIHKNGGLFIADEVQPGFGRTGDSMWGFQRHNVIPDIVTLGKPMGNGYPVAGVATRLDLLERFSYKTGYFNTFGGSPVAASAAMAVLDVIEEERLIDNSKVVGDYLKCGIQKLQESYGAITDVRGSGLFIGVELSRNENSSNPDPESAATIINELRQNKVLIGGAGKYGNILKVRPPMCFSIENADLFLRKFNNALKKVYT